MGWKLGERREGIGVRFWVIDGEEGGGVLVFRRKILIDGCWIIEFVLYFCGLNYVELNFRSF